MNFEPKNKRQAKVFAEEAFRVNVQHTLMKLMKSAGISQRELAVRLEMAEPQVSRFFSERSNPTIKQVARFCCALDVQPVFSAEPRKAFNWVTDTPWSEIPAPGNLIQMRPHSKPSEYEVSMDGVPLQEIG